MFSDPGGRELTNKALLDHLVSRFGPDAGQAMFNDVRWTDDPDAPTTIPSDAPNGLRPEAGRPRAHATQLVPLKVPPTDHAAAAAHFESIGVPTRLGSYGWVVGPQRSAEGYAMLYGGPQMNFAAPEIIHEVQLNGADAYNVVGMAMAGLPFVSIGRTKDHAWTLTSPAGTDNVDVYIETLCDAGTGFGSGYVFGGACTAYDTRMEHIHVRGGATEALLVQRSVHGIIVSVGPTSAVAEKRANWNGEVATIGAIAAMGRAKNLREFERAAKASPSLFNVLYADRKGNIAYWQIGRNPVRPDGYDPRLPQPGDGTAEWTGELRPIPSSINPPRGWLSNWNSKATAGQTAGDQQVLGKMDRLRAIETRLDAGLVSVGDMRDIPKDIARIQSPQGRSIEGREAEFLLPYLFQALDAFPPSHPLAAEARGILLSWDGNGVVDAAASTNLAPGSVIFSRWLATALVNVFGDEFGTFVTAEITSNALLHVLDHALGSGSGVPPSRDYFIDINSQDPRQDPRQILSASFDQALAALGSKTNWTPARPVTRFVHALPAIGQVAAIPRSNRATWAQIVYFTPNRPEGETIFGLGQSGFIDPSKKFDLHFIDQFELFSRFEYKPMPLYLNHQLHE
jgi:penicillin amidase